MSEEVKGMIFPSPFFPMQWAVPETLKAAWMVNLVPAAWISKLEPRSFEVMNSRLQPHSHMNPSVIQDTVNMPTVFLGLATASVD